MDDHGAECELAGRATIAMNRCERSFARELAAHRPIRPEVTVQ